MTDRLFTDCCYGSDQQHTDREPCPQALAPTDIPLLFDTVWRMVVCKQCNGTGTVMVSVAGYAPDADECPGCQGAGSPYMDFSRFREFGNAVGRARGMAKQ